MKSPRELRPRNGLACNKALDARSDRRRLQSLLVQANHLTPRRRGLRGAKAMEEEIHLLQKKPVAALNFELDLSINVSYDSGLEVDVPHSHVDEVVTVDPLITNVMAVADTASEPPADDVVVLEPLATEVMTVADTVSAPLTDEVVAVDSLVEAPVGSCLEIAVLDPPANEAVNVVEAAFKPPVDEDVTFTNHFPTYCHHCEDSTWLNLDDHMLAFHKVGHDDEEPSEPPCQRLCTCGRHRIYLASYAPKFGEKPIKSRINKIVIGQRIEPSDIPGLSFWIQTKNGCFVRPHPEDVGTFEHEFFHSDADAGGEYHIFG